jgi:anti-sigma regulatory factor (Ser/Thr protein kinase)
MRRTTVAAEHLEIPPDLGALPEVSERVEHFAAYVALPPSTLFALQLCVEEALSNTIRHGGLPPDARVRLALRTEPGALVAEITDPGPAFDPLQAPPPRTPSGLDDAGIGGQGIALMRRFCPEIAYARVGGSNRLSFRFPLDHPQE